MPTINLSVDVKEGHTPLTVRFTNVNSGGIASRWELQPGDRNESGGVVSIIRSANGDTATHIYNQPGVYRPLFFIDGPGGGDTQFLADSIVVLAPRPLIGIIRTDVDSVGFDSVLVEGSIQSSFRIFNLGTGPLNGRITLDGDNSFRIASSDTFSIPVGTEDRTIAVRFVPQSAGLKTGRLVVGYNGDPGLKYITLSGRGYLPQVIGPPPEPVVPRPRLEIVADSVSMGNIFAARDTSYYSIPIRNSGTADLKIWLVLDDRNQNFFLPTGRSGFLSLPPGGQDSITVVFGPGTAGSKTANLHLIHTAESGQYVVELTGEATVFVATLEMIDFDGSGIIDFGDFFLFVDQNSKESHSPEEVRTFDLNGDLEINMDDFFIWADFFREEVAR